MANLYYDGQRGGFYSQEAADGIFTGAMSLREKQCATRAQATARCRHLRRLSSLRVPPWGMIGEINSPFPQE